MLQSVVCSAENFESVFQTCANCPYTESISLELLELTEEDNFEEMSYNLYKTRLN